MAESTDGKKNQTATCSPNSFMANKSLYQAMYERSLKDPQGFWAEQAESYLSWYRKWDQVLESDFRHARFIWFKGGTLNASYNCLDRHLAGHGDKIALYWEADEPGQGKAVTFRELYQQVNQAAAALKARGVGKGDRVVLYMPMVPAAVVAMLACARIGAIHCLVLEVFSAESLAYRLNDCRAKMVITADAAIRGGEVTPLKPNVDMALESCPQVEKVLVYDRCGLDIKLGAKDEWWHEALADPGLPETVEPEPMDAEDPLFIMYVSGSMGKPKSLVHTHGGYLLYAAMTTRLVFDLKDDEVFWCATELGWITGHTYIVYGPLVCGATSVLFEGVPDYPGWDRLWQVCAKYKVNKFYTSSTTVRSLAREGAAPGRDHALPCLRLLGSGNEPLSPEAWCWYFEQVGKKRCPVVDTWWQSETGGALLAALPAVSPLKPGSSGYPFFGVQPVIIDHDTGEPTRFPGQEGVLCFKSAWPGMVRTVYGDHPRFIESYFTQVYGTYFSGHAAKMDEEGHYWIGGRIDDVIRVSGHRLGTSEIESALVTHPLVPEAAAVGYNHPVKGQGIYVFVTLAPGATKSQKLKDDLREVVKAKIGQVALPDFIQWADALPKTRSGKILRRVLQKIAAGAVEDIGDTSTMADPSVLQALIKERLNGKD